MVRTTISLLPDGGQQIESFELPDSAPRGHDGSSLMPSTGTLSPAMKLRERIAARSKNEGVLKINVYVDEETDETEAFYIRALSSPEYRELSMRCDRDALGVLDIESTDGYGTFMAACFFMCLAQDESGKFLFARDEQGWEEAHKMANDDNLAVVAVNAQVIGRLLLHNPFILPPATEQLKKQAKETQDFLARTLDSMNPATGLQGNGLENMDAMNRPSSSPTVFSATEAESSLTTEASLSS